MQIVHIPMAGAFLSTLALLWFVMNRQTGLASIGTFLFSTASYGIGWVCTFVVLLVLVKRGGFDWVPLRYLVVPALHLAIGAICTMGIIAISDSRGGAWAWPSFALAIALPLLIQAALLLGAPVQRFPLVLAISLQVAAVLMVPVVRNREVAPTVGESAEIDGLPDTVSIAAYLYYITGEHALGVPEKAARKLAARADHTALIVAALRGQYRLDAMRLLAVEGVPPTPALAAAVADAIRTATEEVRARRAATPADYAIDIETTVAAEVARQYKAYAPQLIPVLEELLKAAGPLPVYSPLVRDTAGRQRVQDWLDSVKGTR